MQAMTSSSNYSAASYASPGKASQAGSSSASGKSDAAPDIHQARSFGDADASRAASFTLGQPARSLPSFSDEQPEPELTTQHQDEQDELTALVALLNANQPIPTQAQLVKGFAESHSVSGVKTANTVAAQNPSANSAALSATGQSAAGLLNAQSAPSITESQPVATKAAVTLDSALNAALNQVINPASGAASNGQAQTQVNAPSAATTVVNAPEWASVRIDSQAGKWGEQMLQVLHDRVTLQAQQNLQEAKIRLDPPDLGKLDLVVRVEGDRLSVQINANAAATREALMQVSDRLRAELQSQNFVHVDVNVGSDQGGQRQSSSQDDAAASTIFAARDSADEPFTSSLSEHWLSTHA
ncbi:flagellar hook-length control protein FliK [Vibrio fluvialis]|uniref:Flagellar hook-length control protein FliK n=1 Tax=Vibrio fluvialis TaxID=676 RepID=A0AAX2LLN5_VIBFL|nr:flagellar hook-length control protein FliK [Vibrio fluvialis]AMF93996.1 flagellar hook-length control protein FliK [Vibrio fluvialis]EKO4011355.1 flagellar hook-length control protein FliK [Vibrio fluvialis]MBY8225421.1 flagellar hook-length control protein FliK [Vibrio fluvialis]MCE7634371.1 flagellar hook-length control protein FliK [Vibrio fluvialis]SUP22071.1 lateral flagellar FliK-like protein - LafE [Vibrio fluvialis]